VNGARRRATEVRHVADDAGIHPWSWVFWQREPGRWGLSGRVIAAR
jgi:hypothetical protein